MKLVKNKGLLIGLTLLLATSNLFAIDYSSHWAKGAIDTWKGYNIVAGYTDGTFKPNNNVTRSEFAAILSRVLQLQSKVGARPT